MPLTRTSNRSAKKLDRTSRNRLSCLRVGIAPAILMVFIYVSTIGLTGCAFTVPGAAKNPGSLQLTTGSLPAGRSGQPYSDTLAITGGTAPYSWSVSAGSPPAGVSLGTNNGVLSGTPSDTGKFNMTIIVSDSSATMQTAGKAYSMTVMPPVTPVSITTTSVPSGQVGFAYSAALAASGGTTPYSWSISSGALPSGLSLGQTNGTISGTPTTSGQFNFVAIVTDSTTPTQQMGTQSFSLTIAGAAAQPPTVTTTSLPAGTVSSAYSATVSASGGTAPYTWSITAGALPAGLSLAASSGAISGTPTTAGSSSFTVQVKDAKNNTGTQALSISIAAAAQPPTVSTTSLSAGTVSAAYSATLAASGGTTPYTWSITAGALPAGLSLAASSGTISGTPTAAGNSSFTVQVKDAKNNTGTQALSISIAAAAQPPTVSTTSLPAGTVSAAYSATLAASGGTTPYTWSITAGALPAGLSLAASSGTISGTPTAAGNSSFTVQVKDAKNNTGTQALNISVAAATQPPPVTTDEYGGRTDLNCTNNAARTANMVLIGNYHYICDPLGHPQWWVGMYVTGATFGGLSTTDRNGNTMDSYIIAKFGDDSTLFSDKDLQRLNGWGFNGLATYSTIYNQPWYYNADLSGGVSHFHTKQMPSAPNVRLGYYSVTNNDSDLPCMAGNSSDCDPPKNLVNSYSPNAQASNGLGWTGGSNSCDWFDARCYTWAKGELGGTGNGQSSIFGTNTGIQSNSCGGSCLSQISWLYAILLDDSDQIPFASCSPQYACINPPQNGIGAHKGMLDLTSSPVMAADNKISEACSSHNCSELYFDPVNYEKRHMISALTAEYGTIGALNAAWGSDYTSFLSSGTCIGPSLNTSPAICGTVNGTSEVHGNGSNSESFSFTLTKLRASQLSVHVNLGGTPVCGDTPGPTSGAYATTDGVLWGPNCSGTIDYLTGAVAVTMNATTHPIWRVEGNGSGTISWYCDQEECGVYPGMSVTISGSMNYNATCTVVSSPAPTAYTASCAQSGNTHTSLESGTLSPSGNVPTTVNISVDYIQDGWGIGTGLADEDGRVGHGWVGTDYQLLTGQTSAMESDEDQQLQDAFTQYFEQGCVAVHAVYAQMMCWGPDSLYRKGVISRYPILKAVKAANASGDLDAIVSQGLYGDSSTNASMLADIETYQGDVPIISGEFWSANADSYFAAPVTATGCSGGNAIVTVPTTLLSNNTGAAHIGEGTGQNGSQVVTQGMADTNYNTGLHPLTATAQAATTVTYGSVTCGSNGPGGTVATSDYFQNEPNTFQTQSARGLAYYNKVKEYLTLDKLPTSGHFITAGVEFWAESDNLQSDTNEAWVTPSFNAYDGVEDVSDTVSCDSISSAHCGGELMNMGNFIGGATGAKAANLFWLGIAP